MAWISLFLLMVSVRAADLPMFLTKHSNDTLRFITMDGRYAYVQKKPGVLGLVSSFRSVDFLTDSGQSDFLVKGSRFEERLLIESIPNVHTEYNLLKNHKIHVVDWGNTVTKEVGTGKASRLHLEDEWVTYFNPLERSIFIQNLETQKKYAIKLGAKSNPFFVPEVEMINQNTVVYTDTNEAGFSAIISYNLLEGKSSVLYKSPGSGTKIELCQHKTYLAMGEFPHDGVSRGSKIMHVTLSKGSSNLAGFEALYSSNLGDLGNLICRETGIYFIKNLTNAKTAVSKKMEVSWIDLRTRKVEVRSAMDSVSQLVEMNGRVLVPLRGDFYVVEGKFNIGTDILKSLPVDSKEELPLDL
ncbi:MAG TPA: hypothetical protein VNJ01_04040 [Bacteriovoracaceae bacterium]|nr:hypothetical protein [Bacteriovoracaceae bacterium]